MAAHYIKRRDKKGNDVLTGRIPGRRIKVVVDNRVVAAEVITVGD